MSRSTDDVDTSRRAFLRGTYFSHVGREGDKQKHLPLGPPPPWHQDKLDTDLCQDCDAPCLSACEPRIIKRYPDGHLLAGRPYLNFAESGCTFCGDCASACPMKLDYAGNPPKLGQVKLDIQSCLAWNDVFCISCRGHCDHGALSLDQRRRMHLDADACTGCGRCLPVCPNKALSFHQCRSK